MSLPIIAIVVCNHFSPFHFSVPCLVFTEAAADKPLFDVKIYAAESDIQTSQYGLTLQAKLDFGELANADVIIIPYWHDISEKPSQALIECLIKAYQRGSHLVGLCLGSYVLGYTGLLDHRRAATHWQFEQDFMIRFPAVNLDINALYVDESRLITSAGTVAGLDCCLYLVRLFYGSTIANQIARRIVLPPHREGGQAQFIERPMPISAKDTRIHKVLHYLQQNIQGEHRLASLAQYALMSRRTFTRQFQLATGMSVGQWLITERLKHSLTLLESTQLSIEVIAQRVGFNSATAFRQQFKRHFSLTPNGWRKNFQGSSASLVS